MRVVVWSRHRLRYIKVQRPDTNGELEFRLHASRDPCFIVKDSAGRSSPNVYFEDEPGQAIRTGIGVPPRASRQDCLPPTHVGGGWPPAPTHR